MSVHEQVVYRNIYTFAIKKRLNEPFSEICPAPNKSLAKYECLTRIYDDGDYISPFEFMEAAKKARVISLITKSSASDILTP